MKSVLVTLMYKVLQKEGQIVNRSTFFIRSTRLPVIDSSCADTEFTEKHPDENNATDQKCKRKEFAHFSFSFFFLSFFP
jgi:hypothetical protein